jgi:hypothetical protein
MINETALEKIAAAGFKGSKFVDTFKQLAALSYEFDAIPEFRLYYTTEDERDSDVLEPVIVLRLE